MTRKLILGFFLVSFLLMTTLSIAGEKPSNGQVATPLSSAETQACYDRVKDIFAARYVWYVWHINPQRFLWNKDPAVRAITLTGVVYDDKNMIKSVRGIDQKGKPLGIDLSSGKDSGQASFYYGDAEQARITEKFHDDERLEASLIYYPNRALDIHFTAKKVSQDTFHVEFRIGGNIISGLLTRDEKMPEVLRGLHEVIPQIEGSASIPALNPVLAEPLACQAAERLEVHEMAPAWQEVVCHLVAALSDFFGGWVTIIVLFINELIIAENAY